MTTAAASTPSGRAVARARIASDAGCVASVTEELSALPGVENVSIDLVVGGDSVVTVASEAPLVEDDVQAAITEAGYALVGATS